MRPDARDRRSHYDHRHYRPRSILRKQIRNLLGEFARSARITIKHDPRVVFPSETTRGNVTVELLLKYNRNAQISMKKKKSHSTLRAKLNVLHSTFYILRKSSWTINAERQYQKRLAANINLTRRNGGSAANF